MEKKLIITDTIDLSVKNKELFYVDNFYKTTDSKTPSFSISDSGTEMKGPVYALLSTAGKNINFRNYDYKSLKDNVENGSWLNPYRRPLLKHHDHYSGDSIGRIYKSFFIDHQSRNVCSDNSENKLPSDVINYFESIGAFDNGEGSTIVSMMVDEKEYERIKNGLDITVSQASTMDRAKCSICGSDYFDCNHYAGKKYKILVDDVEIEKLCTLECYDFYPIELSIVHCPGNDTSVFYVPSSESSGNTSDQAQSEEKNIIKDNLNITNENNNKNTNEDENKTKKMEDTMFKQVLQDTLAKQALSCFKDENISEVFKKAFDVLETEEQVVAFKDFFDSICTKVSDLNDEIAESKTDSDKEEENQDEKAESNSEEKNEDNNDEKTKTEDSSKADSEEKNETKTEETTDSLETKENNLKDVFSGNNVKSVPKTIDMKVSAILNNLI